MVACWACDVTEILTQRSTEDEDYSDLTSPTSNHTHIPDIDMAVSVVYDIF